MRPSPRNTRHEPDGGPARSVPPYDDETRALSEAESWRVLGTSGLGHFAVRTDPVGVDIVPVNYLVTDGMIYFRSGPGSKLQNLVAHPHAALQMEQFDDGCWFSVVVKGEAVRLAADTAIEHSGVLDLEAWQPGGKFNFVRLTPQTVTGRAFVPRHRPAAPPA